MFADNPPGGPFNDDGQLRGSTRWGGNFNLRTGALVIGEIQYALNQPGNGDVVHGATASGLPGTYKLGFWYNSAPFPDQQFDNTGLSLADPASTGIALMRWNNFSIYGVADQMIWRPSEDSPRSVSVFARLMGAPGDRNLINFSVNAGITLKAPFEGRDNDTVGIGFGIAQVSGGAQGFDRSVAFFSGAFNPGPHHRNLHRGHLSVHRRALVAGAAGLPVRVQPGRRDPQPEPADPAHRQRGHLRPAQHHDLLTACYPFDYKVNENASQFHYTGHPIRCTVRRFWQWPA